MGGCPANTPPTSFSCHSGCWGGGSKRRRGARETKHMTSNMKKVREEKNTKHTKYKKYSPPERTVHRVGVEQPLTSTIRNKHTGKPYKT